MKSIGYMHPERIISEQTAQEQGFDPDVAFADPVRYLTSLGIDCRLVSMSGPTAVQEAA